MRAGAGTSRAVPGDDDSGGNKTLHPALTRNLGRGLLLIAPLAACAAAAGPAAAKSYGTKIVRDSKVTGLVRHIAPRGSYATNDSDNWFGYDQGTLEKGDTLFHSISAHWTVPAATQHTAGQAEDSADWIGVGGGCVDSGCDVSDETLIQTGTEQDVASSGTASYDAWYEIIPAPELELTNFTVKPRDQISATIAQDASDVDVWTITISDLTENETYTTTVPYSSTMDSAEWIEETPLELGSDAGLASLPNLTDPLWTDATVNGANAALQPSEALDLTDSAGAVIGTPSAPNGTANGFDECTWATSCP